MKRAPLLALALLALPPALDPVGVEQRVREWQPTARERAWEQIGWAKDLWPAEKPARTTNRPVFLFTHDGRLNVGRC